MTDLTRKQIEALLDSLDAGVISSGMHEDNSTELFQIDDANDVMAEAASAIRATMIERDEAQAAQAEVVERCAEVVRKHAKHLQKNGLTAMSSDFDHIETDIRSLADPTGVKLLAELRARAEKAEAEGKTAWALLKVANDNCDRLRAEARKLKPNT